MDQTELADEDMLRTEIIIETEGNEKIEKRFMEEWLSEELESLLDTAEALRQKALGLERDNAQLAAEKRILTNELQRLSGGLAVDVAQNELVMLQLTVSDLQQQLETSQLQVQELESRAMERAVSNKSKYRMDLDMDNHFSSSQKTLAKAESFRRVVEGNISPVLEESLTDDASASAQSEDDEFRNSVKILEVMRRETETEYQNAQKELNELQEKRERMLNDDTKNLFKRCEAAEKERDELTEKLIAIHDEILLTKEMLQGLTAKMAEVGEENSRLKSELILLCEALNRKDRQLMRATADVRSLKTSLNTVNDQMDYYREHKTKSYHTVATFDDIMSTI
eukprot:Plantae.Rhodophyta-Purpureofilum_apyrenoidigerum.ctg35069.p1 GENE.Plantae.Rhodophyta-Purpureofilum_apyrenoidigerum.ctg35069~~Plantae.Rhodophyta-Purpureofilum_apyrenoidigerum.ctg35069.p1  ORF type:complete len:339 (-),score=103.28 Plantae.Rhodophyta-Purpureofilum_apyrenoidigerum.ctg35069:76-1092(-)